MHSLEPEYAELGAEGLLDPAAALRAIELQRGSKFSVFEEIRFVLYGAVAAITTGLGMLIKENLQHIGAVTLILALVVVAALCYATAVRTKWRDKTRSIGGDYLLLLGALIVSADVGYAESQFHVFGAHWAWLLLALAALHAITAYAFDSRLLLSVSITSLAGWFGIEANVGSWLRFDGSWESSGIEALACASVVLIWREIHRRLRARAQFNAVFEHYAANLAFWGALELCSAPPSRYAALTILLALSVVSIHKGLRNREEFFVIYGIAYTALGLCFVEAQMLHGVAAALVELATVITAVVLFWRFRHSIKAAAE